MESTIKSIIRIYGLYLLVALAPLSIASAKNEGVEFREAEFGLKKTTLSLFNERLESNSLDPKTGILYLQFRGAFKSKKNNASLEVGLLDGEVVSKKIDTNGDGFSDIVSLVRPRRGVEFEEKYDRNLDKSFDLVITRREPREGILSTVVSKLDSNYDGKFDKTSKSVGLSRQPMLGNGPGKACFEREAFTLGGELGEQIFTIAESYGLAYSSSSLSYSQATVRMDIEKSCDTSTSDIFSDGTQFDSIMDEALNEGLNCLRGPGLADHFQFSGDADRRDDPMGVAGVVYLNSVSMLLGQQIFENPLGAKGADSQGYPVRQNDRTFRNLTVMCSEDSSSFKAASGQRGGWLESLRGNFSAGEALGLGSTGRSSSSKQIQCSSGSVTVEHPYISLNMNKFKTSMSDYSDSDKRSELKRLIFHEYLHTTGMEHESHFDPVTSCSICCFPYGDRELVQRACDSCRGESALGLNESALERQVDLQSPFLEIMGVSKVQYSDALETLNGRVPASTIQNLQDRLK
jgi:hypothetical protein